MGTRNKVGREDGSCWVSLGPWRSEGYFLFELVVFLYKSYFRFLAVQQNDADLFDKKINRCVVLHTEKERQS
jgi:hypothetical protein